MVNSKSVSKVTLSNFTNAINRASVFLQTLRVKLYDDDHKQKHIVRAKFDSGSQKSYIVSAFAHGLKTK